VEVIRIGTRVPLFCHGITAGLTSMLKEYSLSGSIPLQPSQEITPENDRPCASLIDAGIPLGNQSVLLKGVNDNADTMKELLLKLSGESPSLLPLPVRFEPGDRPFQDKGG
jgi:lysine 2,3-aminomutase